MRLDRMARGAALSLLLLGGVARAQMAPPVASDAPMPPGHPPTGATPPGPGVAGMDRDPTQPPADDVQDAPDLPAGTIEVQIRDGDDRPVSGAPVGLGILHNSVATGEQREKLTESTDGRGIARFADLKIGAAHSYNVSSMRGPSRFEADPFNMPEKGGRRVLLHVYDTVTDLEEAQIGIRALAFLSLKEDSIQIENMLEVFNLGRTAWQADVPVTLPSGFKAFNKGEEGGIANVDASPEGYVLRGTFKPGRTPIGFRYQVPLENDAAQTVNVPLPPRVAQARIITEASKQMELAVEGAPAARRTRNRDGQAVLVTERAAQQGERGLGALVVTLRGLPTKGPGRYIALGLAAALLIAGVVYVGGKRNDRLDDDAREDLIEAREALLRELVALERAHRKGEVGPKTYQHVRGAMLDALAHVVVQLEQSGVPMPGEVGPALTAKRADVLAEPEAVADAQRSDAEDGVVQATASAKTKTRRERRGPEAAAPKGATGSEPS